ncbi:glycosyltransferase [Prolixibacter bellariivorans]|uniref:glycosyltransferase n=1 Tax=Prolixibacter bellariivorans TaxID=314319 RepID=UPI000482E0B9|nr:glycosyltransferase [Prolixibacter bellariivorans]
MKQNIIYVGSLGFPYGLATIQRQILITRGLIHSGANCRVITRYGTEANKRVLRKGNYENIIPYECAAPKAYRSERFITRNVNKFIGTLNEPRLLAHYKKKGQINVMLGVRSPFFTTLYYRILSLILGYKYIIDVNELLGMENKVLNHRLFNTFSSYLCDGMILISDYLINFYKNKKPSLKFAKVPIICDVNYIDSIKPITNEQNFILYCSSASYLESIFFVIDSFCITKDKVSLKLIISGKQESIQKVRIYVEKSSKANLITIESNIPYSLLISYYKNANALLIPLPETVQHKARFPHKIGEYAACKSPIISNKWGEISNYLDEKSAFLAKHYNTEEFAEQISKCLNTDTNSLVQNAQKVAANEFDFKIVSKKIITLINRISKN